MVLPAFALPMMRIRKRSNFCLNNDSVGSIEEEGGEETGYARPDRFMTDIVCEAVQALERISRSKTDRFLVQ